MEIYGICGAKYAGKDTFARMLGPSFTGTSFAYKLKLICSKVFSLSMDLFENPDLKESSISPIFIDNYLTDLEAVVGFSLEYQGLTANTPRELLQYVGTQYIRSVRDSYWIDLWSECVQAYPKAVVTDLRFVNEAKAVRNLGGKIIKIVRVDSSTNSDSHVSETEGSLIEPDLVVGAVTGKLWLPCLIAETISSGEFEKACLFDYRRVVDPSFKSVSCENQNMYLETKDMLYFYYN